MLTEKQDEALAVLRGRIAEIVTGKRLTHTYGVEREITRLSEIYAPDEEYRLRAAALLHDITKQKKGDEQTALCDKYGIKYTKEDTLMPKTFHARTAVEVIKHDFPEFADNYILGAVRYHTTGRKGMTTGEKLLYLADYIEDTRTFEDCVKLREYFYTGLEKCADAKDRESLLSDTLILSFDMTIRGLIDDGTPIHQDTFEARNYLIEVKEFEQ